MLAAGADWDRLLAVAGWLVEHPRPGVYVRQIDLPGVHTKLVEQHRKLLTAILDEVLPEQAVDRAARLNEIERRYGFTVKPRLVRFRYLDERLRPAWMSSGDTQVTAADFARLEPAPDRVFVTENEVNFLAFPEATGAIVVFGAGAGLEHLAAADWLRERAVFYWGDIDTHGFRILDQFRSVVHAARSLLMDRETLFAHEELWGDESSQHIGDLTRLNTVEQHLYDDLRDNRIRGGLRLEQEHIRYSHLADLLTDC